MSRYTGRQVTVMVVAVCAAVIAAPAAALAATGSFSSATAGVPAVSATNSAAGFNAKAVYGDASASSGSVFGVYGHTNSAQGYGVYSAGRLGTSGPLVCSHCVTGADVNAGTLPTVPDASHLAGHAPSYYARIVPLSWVGAPDAGVFHGLADVGGLIVYASCSPWDNGNRVTLSVAAASDADNGTVNVFEVTAPPTPPDRPVAQNAWVHGQPLSTPPVVVAQSDGATQVEGTAIYRRTADGRVVTIQFHTYGANCEVFGDVLTTA